MGFQGFRLVIYGSWSVFQNSRLFFMVFHGSRLVYIRAVESEFKSNPIFPIFSDFPILSDFLSDFIRFFQIFSDFLTFPDF